MNAVAVFTSVLLFVWANGPAERLTLAEGSPHQPSSELEQSSRKAIIETGFSEAYFDKHFRIVATFDKPGDIRVVWRFSVNGYETTVSDAVGYYTDHQRRIYVHSIKNTLGSARDITMTISRRRARALMRSCLGRYAGEAVALMSLSPGEAVSLYLTAHSLNRVGVNGGQRQRDTDVEKGVNRRNPGVDVPERERTGKHQPIYLGYINLETGRCSKGQAIAAP